MDYEKKYKDALEKVRQLCAYPTTKPFISDLQDLFPELKEFEDEKTRKAIIEYLRQRLDRSPSIPAAIGSWIAWLENIPYTIDHEKREGFHLGYKAALEKQGEQKPAWSEKDEKEYKYVLKFVDNILNNCGNKKDYDHCKRCYDWLKSLKNRIKGE